MEDMVSNRQAGRQQGELATHADIAAGRVMDDIGKVEIGSIESNLVVMNLILVSGCIGVEISNFAYFIVSNSEIKPRKINRTKGGFIAFIFGEESKRSDSRFDCGQRDDCFVAFADADDVHWEILFLSRRFSME